MRVLQVNKFGTRTSGADNYFLDVTARLADAGHDVAVVCMRPSAVPPAAPVFEVPDIDFHGVEGPRAQAAAAARVMWSRTAERVMTDALRTFRPDVVHLHNYAHQLSSSVVAAAHEARVRTFATLHDYKLICPAYTAVRDGRECFRCAPGNPTHCIGGRCLHGSLAWSTVAAAEATFVRAGRDRRVPHTLLAPSQYMADRMSESWLKSVGTVVHTLRNPIAMPAEAVSARSTVRPSGLYVGRLSAEKGLDVTIRASAAAGVPVTIVGDGPERAALETIATEVGAPVTFTGFLGGAELEARFAEAGFFVMTSTWPENAPLALLEALVRGLPALLSDVGGLPELINVYGGGRLVPPRDERATVAALQAFAAGAVEPADVTRLAADLSWDTHLAALLRHYGGTARAD